MIRLVFACREGDSLTSAFLALLVQGGVTVERVDEDVTAITGGLEMGPEGQPMFLGGFSKGARLAASVAHGAGTAPRGLVLLGYPFHPKGLPRQRDALELLAGVRVSSLVLQGERDTYGNRQAIRSVSERVTIEWLTDGNHRFVPRASSGTDQAQLIARAAALTLSFMGLAP